MDSREFFYRFGKALYQIDTSYDDFARVHNSITSGELWIVFALNDGNEYSQKQIAENWEIPKTTVNYVVKDLEARGLVELVHIQGTRREKTVRLTESGKAYADSLLTGMYRKEKSIYDTLKNAERFLLEFEELAEKIKIIGEG